MHTLRRLIALAALAAPAAAQIPLSGSVFDGSGGPLLADTLYTSNGLTVPAGQTLTVQAGAAVKFSAGHFTVNGTLDIQGTESDPVTITSLEDDSVFGDTNGDTGATIGGPGQWNGLLLQPDSVSSIAHARIRNHGEGGWSGVYLNSASAQLTLTDSVVSSGATHGIDLNGHLAFPVVSGCAFVDNLQRAVQSARIDSVVGFSDNTAGGNGGGGGNSIFVTSGSLAADTSITEANLLSGALVIASSLTVPAATTLTLGPGVVFKMQAGHLTVHGVLDVQGSDVDPVVLTSFADDSAAGDTNGDGLATVGGPGQWNGLLLQPDSVSTITHAQIRNHGQGGWSGVYVNGASAQLTLTDSVVSSGSTHGIDLNGHLAFPVVSGCAFVGNLQRAVQSARIDSVVGFSGNTAGGNGGGNTIFVTTPSPSVDTTITRDNLLSDVLVLATTASVPDGVRLTLAEGVHVKMQAGHLVAAAGGTLELLGTPDAPVIVTSFADDSVAGDTNLDGLASVGAPGQWNGVNINAGATGCVLRQALLRFAGQGGWYGVWSESSGTTLDRVRVESCAGEGFRLSAGLAQDLTAWKCQTGIHLLAGSVTVNRATVNACSTGVQSDGGATGSVLSTLAWGNISDFVGPFVGGVQYSVGSNVPAGTGNDMSDPALRDAAAGDLRLTAASNCVDAGDPSDLPTGRDQAGYPRLQDGDLDGIKVVDVGAYEFSNLDLVAGGDMTIGGQLEIEADSHATFADDYLVVGLGYTENRVGKLGSLFVDIAQPHAVVYWPMPPSTVQMDLPVGLPVPLDLVLQLGARVFAVPGSPGNTSNVLRVQIE